MSQIHPVDLFHLVSCSDQEQENEESLEIRNTFSRLRKLVLIRKTRERQ